MVTKLLILLSLSALFLTSAGCDSDDTIVAPGDNTTTTTTTTLARAGISLSIQGTAPSGGFNKGFSSISAGDSVILSVKDAAGIEIGTLILTDARLALKDIKLKAKDEDEEDDEDDSVDTDDGEEEEDEEDENENIKFEGPYVVDLITNTVSPTLDTIQIIVATYTEIELKLHKIKGDEKDDDGSTALIDESDPLFGNSIYIEGLYSGATADSQVTDVPFFLTFDFDEKFLLTGSDSAIADTALGFDVVDGAVNDIIIAFRQAKWFIFSDPETNSDMFDFNDLSLSQDSTGQAIILLDKDAKDDNKEIRKIIKENIKESADYGKDKDKNGKLESDEDDDPDEDDEDDD